MEAEVERDPVLARHLDVPALPDADVADLVDAGDLGEVLRVAGPDHHQSDRLILAWRQTDQPHFADLPALVKPVIIPHPVTMIILFPVKPGGKTLAEVGGEVFLGVLEETVLQSHGVGGVGL